jgi:hypothetical protein
MMASLRPPCTGRIARQAAELGPLAEATGLLIAVLNIPMIAVRIFFDQPLSFVL